MAKATFDWQFHINNYVDNFADSMSLVEYALANDLNRNSARRSMGAAVAAALEAKGGAARATAEGAQTAAKAGIKMGKVVRREVRQVAAERRERKAAKEAGKGSDQLIGSRGEKGSDQLITSSERTAPDQATQRSAGAAKPAPARGRPKSGGRSDQAGGEGADESAMVGEYLGNSGEQDPTRPKKRRVGGDRSSLLGRYAVLTGIDQEILDMVADPEYISHELTLTRARLADMYQVRGEALQKIRKDYNKGGPWIDDNGAPMPKEQALMQVVFGTSQPITELEKSIHRQATTLIKLSLDRQKLALDRDKLALDERNRHPLSLSERIERTKAIFDQRDKGGLTALETTRLFDREGLSYPASLHAEMLREVGWIEPAGDAQGGITDDELERLARDYEDHKDHEMNEWLPAREEAVNQFVATEAARAAGELIDEAKFNQGDLGEGGFGANGYRGEGADPAAGPPEEPLVDFDQDWEEEYQQEEVEELTGYEGGS